MRRQLGWEKFGEQSLRFKALIGREIIYVFCNKKRQSWKCPIPLHIPALKWVSGTWREDFIWLSEWVSNTHFRVRIHTKPINILSGCTEICLLFIRGIQLNDFPVTYHGPGLLSWEIKTTVISRNENDCYLMEWRRLLYPGMTTVISRNEDNCYLQGWRLLSQGMKTTVISRNEDDCYLQGWRRLLPREMKTTLVPRNEDECYLKKWGRLLSPGMTTVMSRNEDNCCMQGWRLQDWRWLVSQEMKTIVIYRDDDCYLQEWRRLLSPGMKRTVI